MILLATDLLKLVPHGNAAYGSSQTGTHGASGTHDSTGYGSQTGTHGTTYGSSQTGTHGASTTHDLLVTGLHKLVLTVPLVMDHHKQVLMVLTVLMTPLVTDLLNLAPMDQLVPVVQPLVLMVLLLLVMDHHILVQLLVLVLVLVLEDAGAGYGAATTGSGHGDSSYGQTSTGHGTHSSGSHQGLSSKFKTGVDHLDAKIAQLPEHLQKEAHKEFERGYNDAKKSFKS